MRVMVRMGRSILPATSQPAKRARTATMARATAELTRSWCESAARSRGLDGSSLFHLVHGL